MQLIVMRIAHWDGELVGDLHRQCQPSTYETEAPQELTKLDVPAFEFGFQRFCLGFCQRHYRVRTLNCVCAAAIATPSMAFNLETREASSTPAFGCENLRVDPHEAR